MSKMSLGGSFFTIQPGCATSIAGPGRDGNRHAVIPFLEDSAKVKPTAEPTSGPPRSGSLLSQAGNIPDSRRNRMRETD
jgi:hypothetical protein